MTVKGCRRGVCCIECDGLAVEIRWVDFDFVQLMPSFNDCSLCYITQNTFSFFKDVWSVNEQLTDTKIWDRYQLLTVRYNEDHDGDLERVWTWRRLSTGWLSSTNCFQFDLTRLHVLICAVLNNLQKIRQWTVLEDLRITYQQLIYLPKCMMV